jgi:hypothetical protein
VVRRVSRAPAPLVPVAPEPVAAPVEEPAPAAEEAPRRGLFRRMIEAVRGADEPETPEQPVEDAPAATVSRSAAPAPIAPRTEAPPAQTISEPPRPGGPAPRAGIARSLDSTAPALDFDPPRPSMTTRRVARSENGTPHLQLVASDGQPRLQRSAAERIAEETGGAIETGEGGLRTVHFPAPGGVAPFPISQQPYTISRELTEGGSAPATSTSSTSESSAPAADSGASDEEKAAEREELYEYFLDRFKRDLLVEREQSGYLIIDNP